MSKIQLTASLESLLDFSETVAFLNAELNANLTATNIFSNEFYTKLPQAEKTQVCRLLPQAPRPQVIPQAKELFAKIDELSTETDLRLLFEMPIFLAVMLARLLERRSYTLLQAYALKQKDEEEDKKYDLVVQWEGGDIQPILTAMEKVATKKPKPKKHTMTALMLENDLSRPFPQAVVEAELLRAADEVEGAEGEDLPLSA